MGGGSLQLKRAAAYARVSTKDQSITSIEGQFKTIENFSKNFGFEIVDKFFDKESGKSMKREQLDVMLEKAYAGRYDVILVEKYDRFSRAGVDGEVVIQDLEKNYNVLVIAALEPYDVGTPQGRFTRTIMLASYTLEGEMISQRTKMRMKDIAQNKYWMGGNPPYGYELYHIVDAEGKKRAHLRINKAQAEVVRHIFDLRLKRIGYSEIARRLNNAEIKNSKGKEWAASTIHDMVENPLYTGVYIYGKGIKTSRLRGKPAQDAIIIENFVEPIISKEVFEEVNQRNTKFANVLIKNNYLLKGLIFTENGDRMIGSGGKTPSYVSSAWHNGKTDEYLGISKNKVENAVFLEVKHKLLSLNFEDDEFWEEFANTVNYIKQLKLAVKKESTAKYQKRLEEINEAMFNIVEAIKSGIISEEIKKENERLNEEKNRILNELHLAAGETPMEKPEVLRRIWKEKLEALENRDEDKLIQIYNQIIEKVVVHKDKYIDVIFKGFK